VPGLQPVRLATTAGKEVSNLTPVVRRGDLWIKRDDMHTFAGQAGGKVRTCYALATQPGTIGLVTASARTSPQQLIVASIAERLGLPCRLHVPASKQASETLVASVAKGAEIIEHRPGYNSVIVARANKDAAALGWTYIPFGMECHEAVRQTAGQVANLPAGPARLVMPVGSGMSLAGVLTGMVAAGITWPVLGVVVGADPVRRLDAYAPWNWRELVELVPAGMDYHAAAPVTQLDDIGLDPYYEAKCLPFLRPGDLFWIVGNRVASDDQ